MADPRSCDDAGARNRWLANPDRVAGGVLEDATPKLPGKAIVTDRKHDPEENPGASADGLGHWISDRLAAEHDSDSGSEFGLGECRSFVGDFLDAVRAACWPRWRDVDHEQLRRDDQRGWDQNNEDARAALDSPDPQPTPTPATETIEPRPLRTIDVHPTPRPSRVRFGNGSACALAGRNTALENQARIAEPPGSICRKQKLKTTTQHTHD